MNTSRIFFAANFIALIFLTSVSVPAQTRHTTSVPQIGEIDIEFYFAQVFTPHDPCLATAKLGEEGLKGPFTLYARVDRVRTDPLIASWEIRQTEPNGRVTIWERGRIDWTNSSPQWCFQKEWPGGVVGYGDHVFDLYVNGTKIAVWRYTLRSY